MQHRSASVSSLLFSCIGELEYEEQIYIQNVVFRAGVHTKFFISRGVNPEVITNVRLIIEHYVKKSCHIALQLHLYM